MPVAEIFHSYHDISSHHSSFILYSRIPSSDGSGTDQAVPLPSAIPNKERHTERVIGRRGLQEFVITGHVANLRKNSKILPV